MNRTTLCLRCGIRPIRRPNQLAAELRDFLKAVPHVARIEYPEPSMARGEPALREIYWEGATEAMAREFANGLAEELGGKCVYCAHIMNADRRSSIPATGRTT